MLIAFCVAAKRVRAHSLQGRAQNIQDLCRYLRDLALTVMMPIERARKRR
jgi:hypothetical protein